MKNNVKPHKGGQENYFRKFNVFEVLTGGAAGGGKSFSLIVDALGLQYMSTLGKSAVEFADYRAVIFRRKTTQQAKLIQEGRKYYCAPPFNAEFISHRAGDPGVSFNFKSGARIFICHLEQEINVEDHQGAEYAFIAFDELTQFTLYQYTYLFSRLRTTIPGLTTRIRSSTNPTGSGLIWVKKRFITGMDQGKTYYYKHDHDNDIEDNPAGRQTTKDDPDAKSRCFVPSRLSDNITLMDNDPDYANNIRALGKRYSMALLDGDWDAFSGSFFEFDASAIIAPFDIPAEWELFAGLDPGYSSPAGFILLARDFTGNIYVLFTYKVGKTSPDNHARDIRARLTGFQSTAGRIPDYCASGVDAWAKRDRHALVSNELTFAGFFNDLIPEMYLKRAIIDRVPGWWAIKQLLGDKKLFFFRDYNSPLIDEITSAEADERNVEDIDKDTSSIYHTLDALRYGIMSIPKPAEEEAELPRVDNIWDAQSTKKDVRKW